MLCLVALMVNLSQKFLQCRVVAGVCGVVPVLEDNLELAQAVAADTDMVVRSLRVFKRYVSHRLRLIRNEKEAVMPRGDRTGPAGAGPMTGRAAGFCAGNSVPGFMAGGFGMGMRRGGGSGRGFFGAGRGLGFARNFGGYGRFGCNPVWGGNGRCR